MPNLTRRNGSISRVVGTYLAPASAYTVNALEVGAECVSNSGTTITVRAGHGFAANDKLFRYTEGEAATTTFRTVSSVTSTTVVVNSTLAVSSGDILVNLGPDTGGSSPAYDGSGVTIYSDMDGTTTISDSALTTDSRGRYGYWVSDTVWELVRSGDTAVELIRHTDSNPMGFSNADGFEAWIGTEQPPNYGATSSGARGIWLNKPSTESGALAVNFARDNTERWSLGEDTRTGDRSFFALWSDRCVAAGGTSWTSGDLLGITPGGTDGSSQDPPKWLFNGSWGATPHTSSYVYEFRMTQSNQSGGSSLYTALFNCDDATTSASGGVVIQTANTRPSLVLRTIDTDQRYAAIQFGRYSSGSLLGFEVGTDIISKNDTQVFSVYDAVAAAHRVVIDSDGDVGIGTSSPDNILRCDRNQNAATRVVIGNTSTGTAGRSGFYAGDGSTGTAAVLERFSTGYTGDTTLQGDAMVYSSGAAMLHLGTNGVKRVTVLDSAAKVGIGVDPPEAELQVNGGIAVVDGMTAPSTITGYAVIYVDTSDGDLKVKFGDGTVKTLATDT